MQRRALLLASLSAALTPLARASDDRQLPRDFGAHPETHTEWWYITGELAAADAEYGFQVTFFRSRVDVAKDNPSRFAARQLIFAHAAISDLAGRRLRHDQRISRAGFGVADAAVGDTRVNLRDWSLQRSGPVAQSLYRTAVQSDNGGFALALDLASTQPVLWQGNAGISRKGPDASEFSHYYSEPHLKTQGTLTLDGKPHPVTGRAWLDHEWSDTYLGADAVGWDWIGMNLDDGSALMAFRIRRRDGTALWAGGSFRAPGKAVQDFGPQDVHFTPLRHWRSPTSQAEYPVAWKVETPAGRFEVRTRLDNQELDSRGSTGSIYWEGTSDMLDAQGRKVGRGYLEMTGYAAALRM